MQNGHIRGANLIGSSTWVTAIKKKIAINSTYYYKICKIVCTRVCLLFFHAERVGWVWMDSVSPSNNQLNNDLTEVREGY